MKKKKRESCFACLMLINKPEEDDGITGQFNHLCSALTRQEPLPQMPLQRAPRQIFEAFGTSPHSSSIVGGDANGLDRAGNSDKGVFFNSHSIGPSPRPTNSRATQPTSTAPLLSTIGYSRRYKGGASVCQSRYPQLPSSFLLPPAFPPHHPPKLSRDALPSYRK